MNLNIGIEEERGVETAKGLSRLLAETYTLYLKTHKYHWNIVGPNFQALHTMFENQYSELAIAVDDIAERIRVLGLKAPGSYSEFSALSLVKEDTRLDLDANEMVKGLLADHEQIARTCKEVLMKLEGSNDEGTNSLLGGRIELHEKTAWMLKSSL